MKAKMTNRTHIEGYLYQHSLEERVTKADSSVPNTHYIRGKIDIATDDKLTNIVTVNFSFVTAKTKKGDTNNTYVVLSNIINNVYGTVMGNGADNAVKLKIDSAFGLNEWYDDEDKLISSKINDGGFIHVIQELDPAEANRNTFDCDMIITNVKEVEANEEKQLPPKAVIKGYIFNFKKALLPVEFSALTPGAMNYFLGLEATSNAPVFTRVKGNQISTTVSREITEESAFGEASVRVVSNTRKDCAVNWAQKEPYDWDAEETITVAEYKEALSARELEVATIKKNQDEYKAQKAQANNALASQVATAAQNSEFDF